MNLSKPGENPVANRTYVRLASGYAILPVEIEPRRRFAVAPGAQYPREAYYTARSLRRARSGLSGRTKGRRRPHSRWSYRQRGISVLLRNPCLVVAAVRVLRSSRSDGKDLPCRHRCRRRRSLSLDSYKAAFWASRSTGFGYRSTHRRLLSYSPYGRSRKNRQEADCKGGESGFGPEISSAIRESRRAIGTVGRHSGIDKDNPSLQRLVDRSLRSPYRTLYRSERSRIRSTEKAIAHRASRFTATSISRR